MNGKRVLMICAAFPPTGGAGVQRSAKFAKYLPNYGWLPAVWTVDRFDGLPRDTSLLTDLPREIQRHIHPCGRGVLGVRRMLDRVARRDGWRTTLARAVDWRLTALFQRWHMPDLYGPWARSSVAPATRLLRNAAPAIRAIYSTYSPASNHLLALELKRRTALPWIADFRDLWTDDPRYDEPSPARREAHQRLEQQILQTADTVICVSNDQRDILAAHVPERLERFHTITNGFDPDDFIEPAPAETPSGGKFIAAHVGRLDRWRTSANLIEGLRLFCAQLPDASAEFELRIVGLISPETLQRLSAAGIPCTHTRYMPHRDAVRQMRSASVLLCPIATGQPNVESIIAGKLFEYLASQRPILSIGPRRGACARLVTACDAGLAVECDPQAIAAAMIQLYRAWRAGDPISGCPANRLSAFDRRRLTGRLAALLDDVLQPPDTAHPLLAGACPA